MVLLTLSLLTVLIIIAVIIAVVLRKFLILVVNSIIGFFALFATSLFVPALVLNIWSVLFVAIGGIIGYILVLILHFTGILF